MRMAVAFFSNHMKAPSILDRLAVCSWSLQPTDPEDLVQKLRATGIRRVQLALDPLRASPKICRSKTASNCLLTSRTLSSCETFGLPASFSSGITSAFGLGWSDGIFMA